MRRPVPLLLRLTVLAALAAGPVQAQTQPQPQKGIATHDGDQPIEITSDRLVVEQAKNTATFDGNVQAVQGDLTLSADELKVGYALNGGGKDAGGAAANANAQPVRRIDAAGHVRLVSPAETAEGRRGAYDVAAGRIELRDDVVLTRGENVIRGDRLDVDLNAQTAVVTAGKAGRVRALFVPAAKGQ
ncbi:MAG: lipopolysaccharide transport periplasmic protein LptA [Geminicoccaceae bacterium]|nr:lipopolysaccharide transport periplasmic protein LptA [Geminicoccaceae bacterium]